MLKIPMLSAIVICTVATIAAVWDLRTTRIPNFITLPVFLAGLVYSFLTERILSSVAAVVVTGTVFVIGFLRGGLGGGDVKLMAAVAAWGGFPFAIMTLMITGIVGGIQALYLTIPGLWQSAIRILSGQPALPIIREFMETYGKRPFVYGPAIALGSILAIVWPMLPGTIGQIGRDIYALLSTILA